MKALLKNTAILAALLGLGLLAGAGLHRAIAHYQTQEEALQSGDYSALIRSGEEPVVLFSTKTCAYCKQAKAFLAANAIAYRNIDVRTPEGKVLFQKFDGDGVPMLMTANLRLRGFSEPLYQQHVLPLAQLPSGG